MIISYLDPEGKAFYNLGRVAIVEFVEGLPRLIG